MRESRTVKSLARGFLLFAALGGGIGLAADRTERAQATVPLAHDLAADKREARAGQRVIVMLFGTPECPWCARVRRQYLLPMMTDDRAQVIVREVNIESNARLVDFEGRVSTHRAFAAERDIRLTPTLYFYGPEGTPLAERIVGFSEDFFGAYLEDRIRQARSKIAPSSGH